MDNQFDSKGGQQNVGQQNNYGVPPEVFAQYVKELGATEQVIRGFLSTLLKHYVPPEQWDSNLRGIAGQYKELLLRMETVQSTDPQVVRLKGEARQAIEAGDYAKAEELLEDAAWYGTLAVAEANAAQARLQRLQWYYAKAAEYWQKAAALLPEESNKERAEYLHEAGCDRSRSSFCNMVHYSGSYKEALSLYEQSLAIRQEIGDRASEATTLNNISYIHWAQGDYATALKYLEQSLRISREICDKAGEGATLYDIGQIYDIKRDYATALKYLEQSLAIRWELGDKAGEGTTLNNISQIYDTKRDYATALKYLEQSLRISQEISDRSGETVISWKIGWVHQKQGDLSKAESYMSRAVQLAEEIHHFHLEAYRQGLKRLRALLQGR